MDNQTVNWSERFGALEMEAAQSRARLLIIPKRVLNVVKRSNQKPIRLAMTLIETIVSITIIGILAAILVPAVQAARESARKTQCQNNLKQIALAAHAFHNANNELPSFYNGTMLSYPLQEWDLFHMHSWRVSLLPYIEQSALRDSVAWNAFATAAENKPVATTVVSTYVCPSGMSPSENLGWGLMHAATKLPATSLTDADRYQVVRSDYDAMAGIIVLPNDLPNSESQYDTKYIRWGVWGWPKFANNLISGEVLIRYRAGTFKDISDGVSNTIMFVERGGRPIHLVNGRPKIDIYNPNADYRGQVGWSASNSIARSVNGHKIGVNEDNEAGVYSTHPGGAFVAIADGSVTFLPDSTDFKTLAQMFGRSDGER